MSDSNRPQAAHSPGIDLTQQRKRAKELVRAVRRGEPDALARVREYLRDTGAELKLAQAQYVVAREAGFPSWPQLKLDLTHRAQSREELLGSLIAGALAGHSAAVESALALAPDLPSTSLHAAAAVADEAAVQVLLATSEAEALRVREAELGGSPLAYLCHARLGREEPAVRARRARIARLLVEAGADPNECVDTFDTPGGKLSVLAAAARHTASEELVDALLEAGAAVEPPGSTAGPPAPPLVAAAIGGSLACLERLIRARAPEWQAREALEIAIERDDRAMVRALLAHDCLPDRAGRWWGRGGGCLHGALALGRDVGLLRMLLEGGATTAARDRDGRSPLQIAVQLGEREAADLLRSFGASDDELTELDRAIGACFAGRAAEPTAIAGAGTSDHQNVCRAVRRGDLRALAALLQAGFDPNVPDDEYETPLHVAVARRDLAAIELLTAHGASPDAVSYANTTVRDLALAEPDDALRSQMLQRLSSDVPESDDIDEIAENIAERRAALADAFEAAVERMIEGDLDGLRDLLDREPALATARSPRYHRATLLHYLGSNGTERPVAPGNAGALAQLLIDRGAIVDASCRMYGGGPIQTTLGLAATTDPSMYPPGALANLIRVLVRGGARIHEPDGRSHPLEGAIMYGATIALAALEESGAKAYDLGTAAALGDLEVLEAHLRHASDAERAEALGSAAPFDRVAVLERLLDAGVDLHARNGYGATALHRAAASNALASLRFLLARGADLDARDLAHGTTAEDWARHFGKKDAQELLQAARANRDEAHGSEA